MRKSQSARDVHVHGEKIFGSAHSHSVLLKPAEFASGVVCHKKGFSAEISVVGLFGQFIPVVGDETEIVNNRGCDRQQKVRDFRDSRFSFWIGDR